MDNKHESDEGGWPTEPIGQPDGQPGRPGQAASSARPRRRHSLATRLGVGIAAVAVLVGGGAAAGVALTSSSPAAAATGQASTLSTVLSSASSPTGADLAAASPAAPAKAAGACARAVRALRSGGHPRAARLVAARCRDRLLRLRILGGIHGQFTFETKKGAKTLAYERGVIQSISSGTVVVRAADGTTWTWAVVTDSVVREGGNRTDSGALAVGQRVFVGGPVVSGANDIRLIVIGRSTATGSPGA